MLITNRSNSTLKSIINNRSNTLSTRRKALLEYVIRFKDLDEVGYFNKGDFFEDNFELFQDEFSPSFIERVLQNHNTLMMTYRNISNV